MSPAILKGVLRTEVPVLQIALDLFQLVRPQALVDARGQRVTQRGDDVPVAVKAHLLAHLKAGVEEAKVRDDLDSISSEATPEGEDTLVSDHLPETVQNSSEVYISAP